MIHDIRIAEDRDNADKGDRVDINISSIGHYPFATNFQNSGIKMNGNWTSMSGGIKLLKFFYLFILGNICPTWGSCVLLVQSLDMQCYTVTYYDEGDAKAHATDFINMIVDLCENKLGSTEKLNFGDWKPTISKTGSP